jgi:predicted ester cyclase
MAGENERIVRRYFEEVLGRGNANVADELVHERAVHNTEDDQKLGLPGGKQGREGAKDSVTQLRRAIPDLTIELQNVVERGDRVEYEFTARGTHRGHIMGHAPTGKQATIRGRGSVRIQDGKIIEGSSDWDRDELARQLRG